MPMSAKGKSVMAGFVRQYGPKKKGEQVAFATANKQGKRSRLYSLFHKGGK